MTDLVTRLREWQAEAELVSIPDADTLREAADEIERLREERDYLRYELNNETDRYMAMKETNSVHIAEIQRLRSLITEWADSVTEAEKMGYATDRVFDAENALRKEAGR